MADLNFKIAGVNVPPPEEYPGLEIELSFENEDPDATVRTTTFTWLADDAKMLNDWKNKGLLGGVGIWEGPSFQMTACNPPQIVFDGCIDMTSKETIFSCDKVVASVKETKRIRFLRDRAASFGPTYLASIGMITNHDYVPVPYAVSTIPDWYAISILVLSLVEFIKILEDGIKTLSGLVDSAVTAVLAFDYLTGAAYTLLVVVYTAYLVFMTTLIISIILQAINEICQPTKFKFGMYVRETFRICCQYLKIGFASTILQNEPYNRAVIIPRKSSYSYTNTYNDSLLGAIFNGTITSGNTFSNIFLRKQYDDMSSLTSWGYYENNFDQFIREMEDVFNARIVLKTDAGGATTLYFERWDYWNNKSTYTIPNVSSEAPFQNPKGTNAYELSANYEVIWQTDTQDQNTIDQYDGTSCMMTLAPNIIIDPQNVLLMGLTQKNLAFALAKRKTSLTIPEQAVNALLQNAGSVYNDLNTFLAAGVVVGTGGVSWVLSKFGYTDPFLSSQLPPMPSELSPTDRIGYMLLSSDFTSVPKFLVVEGVSPDFINGNKIDIANSLPSGGWTDAVFLQKIFHSASWAIDTVNNSHNQYETYENEIPVCCSDFVNIKGNNILITTDKRNGRFDGLKWNPRDETAVATYRVKEKFTNNLKQTFVIDGKV